MTVEHRFRTCCGQRLDQGHALSCVTLRRGAVEEALAHIEHAQAEITVGDDNAAGGHLEMAGRALLHHQELDDLRDAIDACNRACDGLVQGWSAHAASIAHGVHTKLSAWLGTERNRDQAEPEPEPGIVLCEESQLMECASCHARTIIGADECVACGRRLFVLPNEPAPTAVFRIGGQVIPDSKLHPNGHCTCVNEGTCTWCQRVDAEPCECDQVQVLRQERDDARSALDRAAGHALEAEAIISRCLAKMPEGIEHGGCLEIAVDLLVTRQVDVDERGSSTFSTSEPEPCECDQVQQLRQERDDARADRRHERRRYLAVMAARDELQQKLDEALAERDSAQAWSNKHEGLAEHATRAAEKMSQSLAKAHAAVSAAEAQLRAVQKENARQYAAQVGGLEAIAEKCLAKMPADMEHGGCLETAVDLLLARVAARNQQCQREADAQPAPDHAQEGWVSGYAMTQELLDRHPHWESNQYPSGGRPALPSGALDLRLLRQLPYCWRPVNGRSSDTAHGPALVRALRFAVNASGDESGLSDEERNALAKMVTRL